MSTKPTRANCGVNLPDLEDGAWFEHYELVPAGSWRWPNFQPWEIACRGTDAILVSVPALDALQGARTRANEPFSIWSAYRSPIHNAREGGAPKSMHLVGGAFDIALAGHSRADLLAACREAGFKGFGHYRRFLHADIGRERTWGSWT